MTILSTEIDGRLASLTLMMTDVRAHFEAQLRAVVRAEEALVKCRTARDRAAFDLAATMFRDDVQRLSHNNRSVRAVIDQMDVDSRDLA
jgi:hypothetical protein